MARFSKSVMGKRKRATSHVPRKRRRRARTRRVPGLSTLIPKTKTVQLKYVGSFTLTDSELSAGHLVSCNGMFDPDITGTGHQPLGFDNWMAFYHHFEVRKSKVTFWINNGTAVETKGTYAVLRLDSDTTTDGVVTLEHFMEQPSTVTRYMNPSNGGGRTTVSKSWNQAAQFGKHQAGNSVMKGDVSANPSEQTYYRLKLVNSLLSDDEEVSHTVVFQVMYTALLTERKDMAQS